MRPILITLALLNFASVSLLAAPWPSWRGPDGLGVSQEKNLPAKWDQKENVAWKATVPGSGASSPIVFEDRVYVTSQTADKGLHVLALDRASGKILWDREIDRGALPANKLHNMATPTPVTDGKNVWVMFGTGDLACLDLEGKVVWHRNLVKEYGEYKTNHGYGSSPMLLGNNLFIACMHQGPSYLAAINARTGKNVWKVDRNLLKEGEAKDSYSSPIFLRTDTGNQVIVAGAETLDAYDPEKGDRLWHRDGLKVKHPYGRTIAGPTVGEGVLITVASGFRNQGYTVALKADGKGDISSSSNLWTQEKFSPDCPTPLVYQGKVFAVRDDGNASCLDLKTGEALWQERLYSADVKVSPVAGDGKIYFMNGRGNCTVVKAAGKYEVIATNELNEATLSTPAIAYGHLFLRAGENLYCVGQVLPKN